MKLRISLIALLCLSWIASGIIGAAAVTYWNRSAEKSLSVLRAKEIDIVDGNGASRIALGMEHDQPFIRLSSPDHTPLLRLAVDRVYPSGNTSSAILIPTMELNDGTGQPTIEIVANKDQRGLIAFSSPKFDGKVMLGHFGITDDGTDTGIWGLQVSSRLHGLHTDRALGVMTSNGNDTELVWPAR
jgi:hypothetical protein